MPYAIYVSPFQGSLTKKSLRSIVNGQQLDLVSIFRWSAFFFSPEEYGKHCL